MTGLDQNDPTQTLLRISRIPFSSLASLIQNLIILKALHFQHYSLETISHHAAFFLTS